MHTFFLSLTLAAGISGLLLYGLNRHPLFKLYRRPPSQHLKFITTRLQQVLCVVVWSVTAMLPLSVAFASLGTGSTLAELLPYLLGMCLLIFLINPKMQLPTTPDLVFTPSLFTASVNIHLTKADQPFTRSTYRQLSILLDTLPRHGIHSVVMASPMFYYSDGTLRSLELLERTIQRVGGTLHDKPVPGGDAWLEKLSCARNDSIKKTPHWINLIFPAGIKSLSPYNHNHAPTTFSQLIIRSPIFFACETSIAQPPCTIPPLI